MRRAAIAVAAAAALLGAAPAAQARTDDLRKPVLLVAGPEDSCARLDDFATPLAEYTTTIKGSRESFSGTIDTLGTAANCLHRLDASGSFDQLADRFADYVKQEYTDKGKTVDAVGYGGGGLIIRRALMQHRDLRIEDAVTIGTPHAGSAALAASCGGGSLCDELKPGSPLINALAQPGGLNPQGKGGTDWSEIGSESDALVPADSAVAMSAEHRTLYYAPGPGHEALLTDAGAGQDMKIRHSHGGVPWIDWNKAPHPAVRAFRDLAFGAGDVDRTCGLEATKPDQCGVTPVILVPGFGASVIECTTPLGKGNLWPDAILDNSKFYDMALGADGVGPFYANHACAKSSGPSGEVLQEAAGQDIHKASWAWIQRIAPGHAYAFGWDFRKGPDQSLERLDQLVDKVLALHGASKVAIVAHSYGGLMTRWYIDDPVRARKVARVANFGSPWWGAPKSWFAMAYGYETPDPTPGLDWAVRNTVFRVFTRNLAGLYYLFPPQAWFDHVPAPLRNWLEVDDQPATKPAEVADAVDAFGGNPGLAMTIAGNHAKHIDGFKRGGVDWRTFIGSGLPTLGHIRAWTNSDRVQYSWINGDGTVPLMSQRQSARRGDPQMGTNVPTYNFCNTPHMVEMEKPELEAATQGFITEGRDPQLGGALWANPCPLNSSQFVVTHDEDATDLHISELAENVAGASRVRARAAAAGPLTLDEAERQGLVDVIHEPHRTVFVVTTPKPLTVHAAGTGELEVTPLVGDAKTGPARVYDLTPAGVDVAVTGSRSSSASPSRAADRMPPRTKLARRGGRLRAKAIDASGVAVTLVQIGKGKPRRYTKPLRAPRRATVRYWSVDVWGNTERRHRLR